MFFTSQTIFINYYTLSNDFHPKMSKIHHFYTISGLSKMYSKVLPALANTPHVRVKTKNITSV